MATRIDLPGGGWADIKNPDELSNRERKLVRRYALGLRDVRQRMLATGIVGGQKPSELSEEVAEKLMGALGADDLDGISDMQAAFIVAYTAAWSLDLPLPTLETVDDLPGPLFDALAEATSDLGDGSLEVSPDGAADPASPTGPSPA